VKIIIACVLSSTLLSCAPHAMNTTISHAIDTTLAVYNESSAPGASVTIIKDGSVLYTKGYGSANLEEHQKAMPLTNYRLASVTKQFTATAILLLIERRKLSLDSRLADVLPGTPAYAKDVKIRHLLSHTGGLVDYEDLIPDSQTVQVLDKDVLALISKVDSVYFPAGTKFRYSNTGYALLALAVEAVSGQTFSGFLKQNIFKPLGMKHTVAYEKGISTVDSRAFGYSRSDTIWARTDQSVTSAVLGDGGIYSSVEDLFKWDQDLSNCRLVSPNLRQQSFTPVLLNDGTPTTYGFGWFIEPYKGHPSVYHTGATRGFRNAILRIPDERLTVILLTNRNEGEPIDLARKIADLILNASNP
jgi:CubicO group peptidase (beta-lactamase class C family)